MATPEAIIKPVRIETKPFVGQKPGTSGLRKRVWHIEKNQIRNT
jgi:phosphoglucomutase